MAALEVSEMLAQSERSWERCRSDSVQNTARYQKRGLRNMQATVENGRDAQHLVNLKTARGYAR
jgi:hypothetical protein